MIGEGGRAYGERLDAMNDRPEIAASAPPSCGRRTKPCVSTACGAHRDDRGSRGDLAMVVQVATRITARVLAPTPHEQHSPAVRILAM